MSEILRVSLEQARQFAEAKALLEKDHPSFKLTLVKVDGDAVLRSEQGGVRFFWIYCGEGEVFLPEGYHTQEGDGDPLPAEYEAAPLDAPFADVLRCLKEGLSSLVPGARVPAQAIAGRLRGKAFVGDIAGDLWTLEHIPRPWSQDAAVEAAIGALFRDYRGKGFSTKRVGSYEPIRAGDQLIACAQEEVQVRGQLACLALEKVDRQTSHVSSARRLRYLLDTAGGCNPDFAPFRRLPLTWYLNSPGEQGDGLNFANSHVVNIPQETSPTHFHPPRVVQGGIPQTEMYLVLDPQAYRLNTSRRSASLIVFPDLQDLGRYAQHPLQPGDFVYIPPSTGHRGIDVFVNVLTIPGFKPHNEFYLDRDIHDNTGGKSPYNESFLGRKNYQSITDLL